MRTVTLDGRGEFGEWRHAARRLLADAVAPDEVRWQAAGQGEDLFGAVDGPEPGHTAPSDMVVPKGFIEAAETAICHSDPDRFSLLYRILWRLQ